MPIFNYLRSIDNPIYRWEVVGVIKAKNSALASRKIASSMHGLDISTVALIEGDFNLNVGDYYSGVVESLNA